LKGKITVVGNKEGELMEKQFNCPECGSDGTQKAKVLYESGTSTSTSTMAGIGVGTGGKVGVGVGAGRGSSQSELARKLSPPAKPGSITPGVIWIIGGIIMFVMAIQFFPAGAVGAGVFFVLVAGGFGMLGYRGIKKENGKRASYNDKYAKWDRLWYCVRCGHTFYIQ
jgi:transcription elongation factor Elf1